MYPFLFLLEYFLIALINIIFKVSKHSFTCRNHSYYKEDHVQSRTCTTIDLVIYFLVVAKTILFLSGGPTMANASACTGATRGQFSIAM